MSIDFPDDPVSNESRSNESRTEPKEVPDWTTSDYLIENDFAVHAARRIELKATRAAVDEEIDDLNAQLAALLKTARMSSVRFGAHRLQLGQGWRGGKLSKARLLELGVSAAQIAAATSEKEPGDPFISIHEIGKEGA